MPGFGPVSDTDRLEQNWKKTVNSVEYHECFLPHSEHAVEDILQYYWDKFPQHKTSKIPLVMDLACGTGKFTERLADHCERVVATDMSPSQIVAARQLSTHSNVVYDVCSVYELSRFVGAEQVQKADLITVGNAAHYFNNKRFYDEARRCLKIGGVLAESSCKISDFPGLPEEAYRAHFDFWKSVLTNQGSNEVYNQMFDHVITGYKNMEVFLEEKEHVTFTVDHTWSLKQMCSYLLFSNMNSRHQRQMVEDFYGKLWREYEIGDEGLVIRIQIDTVYTQNMKLEE